MSRPLKYLRIFLQTLVLTFFAYVGSNYVINNLTTLDNFDFKMLATASIFFASILTIFFILYLEFLLKSKWFKYAPTVIAWVIVLLCFASAFVIDPTASAEGPMSISTFAVIIFSTIFYAVPSAFVITVMAPFGISQLNRSSR